MISLSIIVPVFRAEQFLEQCVQSLLNQGFYDGEYEIILVDDGSDDNCPKICDHYAELHPQIRVIHQENKGLSEARNAGIREAKGKYVTFVDADDYVETGSYNAVLQQVITNHLDILQFRVQIVRNNKIIPIGKSVNEHMVYTGEQFIEKCMGVKCYAVRYLIRRTLMTENAIFFHRGIHYEDVEWLPRILYSAQRVMQSNDIIYNYVIRENTITHPTTKEKWERLIQDNLFVLSHYADLIAIKNESKWLRAMSANIITSTLTIVAKQFYKDCDIYIGQIKTIYPYPLISKRTFPFAERVKVIIARISPNLYCFIRHYL